MNDLANQLDELDFLEGERGRVALEACVVEDVADESIEALGFALHAVELLRRARRVLPREADGHLHAGERRAQLVGDVAQQPLAGRDQRAQALGHGIELAAQHTELVAPARNFGARACVEVSAGEQMRGALQPLHRVADRAREQVGDEPADGERECQQARADGPGERWREGPAPRRRIEDHIEDGAIGARDPRRRRPAVTGSAEGSHRRTLARRIERRRKPGRSSRAWPCGGGGPPGPAKPR